MENSLTSILTSIDKKIDILESRRDALERECGELTARCHDLSTRLAKAEEEVSRLSLDCEYLRVSHRLADSDDTLVEARRHIARLIKRIDASISLLKDDAAL